MKCSVSDCENTAVSRTWCRKHYMRWWTHGDVNVVKKIMPPAGAIPAFLAYAKSYTGNDCLIWPYSDNGAGYAIITVDGERVLASRVICEDFRGPPPTDQYYAAHSCGFGHLGCITRNHLRWATPGENSNDRNEHGTMLRGSQHPGSKLTEKDVLNIFGKRAAQRHIASEFGVSQTLVGLIKRGQRWQWLTQAGVST